MFELFWWDLSDVSWPNPARSLRECLCIHHRRDPNTIKSIARKYSFGFVLLLFVNSIISSLEFTFLLAAHILVVVKPMKCGGLHSLCASCWPIVFKVVSLWMGQYYEGTNEMEQFWRIWINSHKYVLNFNKSVQGTKQVHIFCWCVYRRKKKRPMLTISTGSRTWICGKVWPSNKTCAKAFIKGTSVKFIRGPIY